MFGITIERSPDMIRTGWMAYDAGGRCVACGEGNTGSLVTDDSRVVRIVCGTTLYDFIIKHVEESGDVSPDPEPDSNANLGFLNPMTAPRRVGY